MVKKLIQLEPGDWESYINEVRASLDTTRATEAPTTSGDLAADKVKTSAQTQISTEKIDQGKTMEITHTTLPVKCATEKSPSKTRSKDRRFPIRPPTPTDTSQTRKVLKTNKRLHENKKYTKLKTLNLVTNSDSL